MSTVYVRIKNPIKFLSLSLFHNMNQLDDIIDALAGIRIVPGKIYTPFLLRHKEMFEKHLMDAADGRVSEERVPINVRIAFVRGIHYNEVAQHLEERGFRVCLCLLLRSSWIDT